jgi:hypothetical protein
LLPISGENLPLTGKQADGFGNPAKKILRFFSRYEKPQFENHVFGPQVYFVNAFIMILVRNWLIQSFVFASLLRSSLCYVIFAVVNAVFARG